MSDENENGGNGGGPERDVGEIPTEFGNTPPARKSRKSSKRYKKPGEKRGEQNFGETRVERGIQVGSYNQCPKVLNGIRGAIPPVVISITVLGLIIALLELFFEGVLEWDARFAEYGAIALLLALTFSTIIILLTRPRNVAFTAASAAAAALATVISAVAFFSGLPEKIAVENGEAQMGAITFERTVHDFPFVQSAIQYFVIRVADYLPTAVGLFAACYVFGKTVSMVIELHRIDRHK